MSLAVDAAKEKKEKRKERLDTKPPACYHQPRRSEMESKDQMYADLFKQVSELFKKVEEVQRTTLALVEQIGKHVGLLPDEPA